MKFRTLLNSFLLIICILASYQCTTTQIQDADRKVEEDVVVVPTDEEEELIVEEVEEPIEEKEPKPTTDTKPTKMKTISLRGSLEVKVGEKFGWSYDLHPSVGNDGAYRLDNDKVVVFQEKKVVYENPENMKAGMSGADGSRATFVFEGAKAGTTEITFKRLFRGQVKSTQVVKITVIE